ncbi:metal ABC transporter substrate-binding protein [Allorhizocola rhizosphaerae]|uniref:metal ABC transporter substrate-binding protein n=1 Tax=Allorhizocola rhizosphaerae TaxID=1872709 RepID=UPI000E3E76AC|nr:metal ABC transporter substrate-binding protein [Allorhizocola rhizosphaerae]
MLSRILIAAAALTTLAACGGGTEPAVPGKVDVVAGFYPLQFVAQRVGGDHVQVTNLAQPGAEPHDLELKPSQITQVAGADLVIYLKGFQPELDKAVEQNAAAKSFDVTTVTPLEKGEAHEHETEPSPAPDAKQDEELDPHVWLDPTRLATIAEAVASQLGKADATYAADYTANAQALKAELTKLDGEFTAGLKTCERREIVTSHAAFGYLAKRYDLEQIGITGLDPEAEPTPQRLAEVAEEAKEHDAKTIFFETLVSPKVAEALAKEVGAKTAVLDPLEGLAAGSTDDYFSVMRANLKTLREALGCA